jgi:Flp pilus assembly protein TadG
MLAVQREDGQALVEFTLVLPLLVVLLLAIVQLGIAFNHYLVLTDAVRAGARAASVSRLAPDPVATATDAVVADLVRRLPLPLDRQRSPYDTRSQYDPRRR